MLDPINAGDFRRRSVESDVMSLKNVRLVVLDLMAFWRFAPSRLSLTVSRITQDCGSFHFHVVGILPVQDYSQRTPGETSSRSGT